MHPAISNCAAKYDLCILSMFCIVLLIIIRSRTNMEELMEFDESEFDFTVEDDEGW